MNSLFFVAGGIPRINFVNAGQANVALHPATME